MTSSQTTATAHGEIVYETVACENCGGEMLPDETVTVGVGLYHGQCDSVICDERSLHADERTALCPVCADAIFGYGQSRRERLSRSIVREAASVDKNSDEVIEAVMILMVIAAVAVMVMAVAVA